MTLHFFFFLIEEINAICLKLSLFLSVSHRVHSHWPRKWCVCVRSAGSLATHQNISAWVPPHRESYYIVWNEAWTLFLFVWFLQPSRWFSVQTGLRTPDWGELFHSFPGTSSHRWPCSIHFPSFSILLPSDYKLVHRFLSSKNTFSSRTSLWATFPSLSFPFLPKQKGSIHLLPHIRFFISSKDSIVL